MGRSLLLGLSASLAGVITSSIPFVASADEAPIETASVMVRAWGKSGSVEPVRRSERPALARDVRAGTIPRVLLQAEMAHGIARFLRQVRTEAVVSQGHFAGWRLLSLFASRHDIEVQVLRPGDTILRVNGESIERPEAFKSVWDSLGDAKELVLEIEREGQRSTLHYTITG